MWNFGGSPGLSSGFVAAPSDNVGVIAFANSDLKQEPVSDIVGKVAQQAFGGSSLPSFRPPGPTRRSFNDALELPRHAELKARTNDKPPDVDMTGFYQNPGYGKIELCSVRSTSSVCCEVMDTFRTIDKSLTKDCNSTDLFAAWDTLLSTHMRFQRRKDCVYTVTTGSIYPKGYGKNTTAFSTLAPYATAEFVMKKKKPCGFGFNILADDDGSKRVGSVEDSSDVWFAKK